MPRALLVCCLLIACKHDDPPAAPPPPAAKAPIRGASADTDLRVMLAEIASSKACDMIRGQFRGTRAAERPELVTGVLWIRDCKITHHGTDVTFELGGNGWQWAAQSKQKAGGKFSVAQYVKFAVDFTMEGALDMAYDRTSHIVSLWFTPKHQPNIDFKPTGDFDVDRVGAWSTVIGALGGIFNSGPETLARKDAKKQGTQQFEQTLADGLAVTINLCTGLGRFNLGRKPKGEMQPPDVGETKQVPTELHPGGIAFAGPQLAPNGMTMHVEATHGRMTFALACAKDAEAIADAFVNDKPLPTIKPLGVIDVRGRAKLTIKPTRCPVVAIASPLDNQIATVSWLRLPSEIAQSTGGPVIQCAKR